MYKYANFAFGGQRFKRKTRSIDTKHGISGEFCGNKSFSCYVNAILDAPKRHRMPSKVGAGCVTRPFELLVDACINELACSTGTISARKVMPYLREMHGLLQEEARKSSVCVYKDCTPSVCGYRTSHTGKSHHSNDASPSAAFLTRQTE